MDGPYHFGKVAGMAEEFPNRIREWRKAADLTLEQLAGRIWRLAPETEGAPYFYAAVADALEAEGESTGAARWRERAYAGLPRAGFMPGGLAAEGAGVALNGLFAGLLALVLTTFVKGLRYLPTQRRAGRSAWNPLSLWTRSELLGTLVVLGLLF